MLVGIGEQQRIAMGPTGCKVPHSLLGTVCKESRQQWGFVGPQEYGRTGINELNENYIHVVLCVCVWMWTLKMSEGLPYVCMCVYLCGEQKQQQQQHQLSVTRVDNFAS